MARKNITRHRMSELRRGTEAKSNDPYVSRRGMKEPAKCNMCQSVYHHKRWYLKDDPIAMELQDHPMQLTVCPACRKSREHYPEGVITLRGEYLIAQKKEILNLVRNEEARAKENNPLERIISIKEVEKTIEIQTTTERLAERIGKEVKRAFGGQVTFHWTHGDKMVRVGWSRESGREKKNSKK